MRMERGIIFLLVSITTIVHSLAFDYCNISNCKHTLCTYPKAGQASTCGTALGSGLTATQKKEILNAHNTYRQKVASGKETRGSPGPQPAATSMPNLTWDTELETIAQRWADQCTFEHDSCRTSSKYNWVGQCLLLSYDVNNISMESVVQAWTDEVQYFNKNQVKSFDFYGGVGGEIGHYTQVVWAETKTIGCGASKYKPSSEPEQIIIACNYGPGGNVQGESVYPTA